MSKGRRLVAMAAARALLAGPPHAAGLSARLAACLGGRQAWMEPLAQRLAAMPRERWRRLQPLSLARWLEQQAAWRRAWQAAVPPRVRRHILRPPQAQAAPPLGLDGCALPSWPTVGDLAAALNLSPAALWRLTRPAGWQRRAPPAQQHVAFRWVAKRRGGWRLLEVPEPYLMALQRRLLALLLNGLPVHEAACGFVPGRSVLQHAALHAGQAVLLKFDLRDFFGSVHAGRVHALWATLGYPHAVAQALTALCTTATPEPWLQRAREAGRLDWAAAQRLRVPHLPQGAPSSPALAQAHGAHYRRYADDLAFSSGPGLREALPRLRRAVAAIVAGEGFALHAAKTALATQGRQQRLCGLVVNDKPNVPRKAFDRLKAQLHDCVRHGPAAANRGQRPDWRAHLQGRLAWVRQVNPAKALRLQRLWAQIRW